MKKKEEGLTQIVVEVQKDIGQFELLYSQIINKVYFWCYNIAGDEATASDMTQEAILQIYTKIGDVKKPEYFTSWMYRVVRNTCLNYLRANKRFVVDNPYGEDFNDNFEVNIKEENSNNLPKEAFCEKEMKNLIRDFIDKLPKKQREVIILYYLEEFNTTEIAEMLADPLGSIRSRLYEGRKNLESQIKDYQIKNNVKLYSLSLFPLLGIALKEYQEEICSKQNLAFDKSTYTTTQATTGVSTISCIITSKLVLMVLTIITISIAVIAGVNHFSQNMNSRLNDVDNSSLTDILLYNNKKANPYIKDITCLDFPTRTSVEVYIELKKDLSKSDIQILFKDREVSFEKEEKDVFVQANENGVYTIIIDGKKAKFKVTQIQEYAPEVIGIWNYGNYLVLDINDELSRIDYEKSYVKYQDKEYKIDNDLKVYGTFKNEIELVIYDRESHCKTYIIKVD